MGPDDSSLVLPTQAPVEGVLAPVQAICGTAGVDPLRAADVRSLPRRAGLLWLGWRVVAGRPQSATLGFAQRGTRRIVTDSGQ